MSTSEEEEEEIEVDEGDVVGRTLYKCAKISALIKKKKNKKNKGNLGKNVVKNVSRSYI